MKKFMNFIGEGVGEQFLHDIRRVTTTADFFRVCEEFLDHESRWSTSGGILCKAIRLDGNVENRSYGRREDITITTLQQFMADGEA